MGRRSNPLSTRVGRLLAWPSNVSHPFLSSYLSHIFQECIVASPGIRSSTTGVWINLTLFPALPKAKEKADYTHPKIREPVLDFQGIGLSSVLGRFEERTRMLGQSHKFFQTQFKGGPNVAQGGHGKTFLQAIEGHSGNSNHALHIYRDTPIRLKVNVITNPLLNAEVMAKQIAHASSKNTPLSRIFKSYLQSI